MITLNKSQLIYLRVFENIFQDKCIEDSKVSVSWTENLYLSEEYAKLQYQEDIIFTLFRNRVNNYLYLDPKEKIYFAVYFTLKYYKDFYKIGVEKLNK